MKKIVHGSLISAAAVAAVIAGLTAPSLAQDSGNDAMKNMVEARQGLFKLMGFNMAPLGGMLRNQVDFDASVVKTNAQNMADLARMIPAVFALDTSGSDIESEALDRIWSSQDTFSEKAQALEVAANNLVEAADSGNEGATKAAMAKVGQACGSCHDDFRAD